MPRSRSLETRRAGAHGGVDPQLERYMLEVNKHPVLSRAQERALAETLAGDQDVDAAHRLVVANLRFVVKVAHGYAAYGIRLLDLIQEGNVGLMVAVKRFDPSRGYRLISYAVWWIRAYIQSYIMRSWSLVRLGATRLHRKLFFRLRGLRAEAQQRAAVGITPPAAAEVSHDDAIWGADAITGEVAAELGASPRAAADMGRRLAARDFSLDAPLGDEADAATHLERLPAPASSQEERLLRGQQAAVREGAVAEALADLSERERTIVERRLLDDEPRTLADIGQTLGVSRERVRQIESRAVAKLRAALTPAMAS